VVSPTARTDTEFSPPFIDEIDMGTSSKPGTQIMKY
jgi:hypothetical protein